MKLTGAQILVKALQQERVEVIFGYPGGAVLPTFDAFYKSKVNFVLSRHEQGAAHMADGYARATGKVGVCLATSGPGATNLVTGIATAYMDSIPVVALTGQVKTSLIGNDAFQEVDIIGITRPVTKHSFLVRDISDLAANIREAFYIARTGRPGPVLIDLPVNVMQQQAEFDGNSKINLRGYNPKIKVAIEDINKIMKVIQQAKRPLFYVGGGIITANASKEFTQLAQQLGIPVTMTLLGLGCFPATNPLSLGMLGMHGTTYANLAVQNCDLLISIGARFDDRVTGKVDAFAPHAKIIHIDIDPASISKNVRVDYPVVGDAKVVIKEMLKLAKKLKIDEWRKQIKQWKNKNPLRYNNKGSIKPQYVLEQLSRIIDGNAILVTDVGQHQMWTAQWIKFSQPRTLLTSGGLGTMGYGLPAAIGAQIAKPKKKVILIAGDGSIQMNSQELATLHSYNIPVKIFIFNNGYLGMVRQWQELFYGKRYSHTDLEKMNPDFVEVARGYKIYAERVADKDSVGAAIKRALKHRGPVVLDFNIAREENVYPMVPAGQAIDRMIGGMA